MRQIVFGLANLLRALNKGEGGILEIRMLKEAVDRAGGPVVARLAHLLSMIADELPQASKG